MFHCAITIFLSTSQTNQTNNLNIIIPCINFSCLSRISLHCQFRIAQQIRLIHKSSIFLCWISKTTLAMLPLTNPTKEAITKPILILSITTTITIHYSMKYLLHCYNFLVPITLVAQFSMILVGNTASR